MLLKKCLVCGLIFRANNPAKKYCSTSCAQKLYNRRWREKNPEKARAYQIRWWNHNNKGTFTPSRYLSIRNGRVVGAVLLERDKQKRARSRSHGGFVNPWIAYYSGDREIYHSDDDDDNLRCDCGSDVIINIVDHEAYCSGCGGKISLAFENEYYSVTELTCRRCGLVYTI
jgi:hypothetical protein